MMAADNFSSIETKRAIVKAIRNAIDEKPKLSIRQFAESVGMTHVQIIRITRGENYHIDTLLRVLDGLDLELVVQPRQKSDAGD